MAELIKDQILPPQQLLQENSYTMLLFHQQFFCPSARRYDISARTKTSSLNCHQPCLRWIKTSQLPPGDVSQKCHFYPRQVMPQLTVFMSFQEEGAEGGKRERRRRQPLAWLLTCWFCFPRPNFPLLSLWDTSYTSACGTYSWHRSACEESTQGLARFGVLGIETISSSFGHNIFSPHF